MTTLTVVGLDPSMTNFGMVRGRLDMVSGLLHIDEIKLIETKPTKNKSVRKNTQDLERMKALYDGMTEFIKDADIIFAEMPVGSQSANGMKAYGASIAVLATIPQSVIQVTASEVKIAACGKKTASKFEMIEWAYAKYPKLDWAIGNKSGKNMSKHTGFLANKNEHAADAIATIFAGVKTGQFKQLALMYNNIK